MLLSDRLMFVRFFGTLSLLMFALTSTPSPLQSNPFDGVLELSERLKQSKLETAHHGLEEGRRRIQLARRDHFTHDKSTGEGFGDFDIKSITARFVIRDHSLPDSGTFTVQIESTSTDELNLITLLRAYVGPRRVWTVSPTGEQQELTYSWVESDWALEINIPTLEPGETLDIWIRTPIEYNWSDTFGQFEAPELAHYVGLDMLPVNYEYPRSDRYLLNTEFEVEGMGVFPNAQGLITVSGNPNNGVGSWRFESEGTVRILALTLTDRPMSSYSELIDMTSPNIVGGSTESYFGFIASDIINSFRSLVAPFPFMRFTISTLSVQSGVAIGPQGMILMPDDYWFVDAQQSDVNQWYLESLMAHEIGHQYFPHIVHLQETAPGWLSEAFAEFLAGLHMKNIYQHDYQFSQNHWQYMYHALISPGPEPSVVSDDIYSLEISDYFTVLYKRGSSILHQLSRRYDNFNDILINYVSAHSGRLVNLEDFIEALEVWGSPNVLRPRFELTEYLDSYLYGTARLILPIGAQYVDDLRSSLSIRPAQSIQDSLELKVRYGSQTEQPELTMYLSIDEGHSMLYEAQSLAVDPHREYFLIQDRDRPADVDLNGVVDGLDVLEILAREGLSIDEPPSNVRGTPQSFDAVYDVNRDGRINNADLALVLSEFGVVDLADED